MRGDRAAAVGIVVPAYNAAAYLGATLNSVLAQTYGDWQCVVVDDGSTDATRQLALDFTALDSRFVVVAQDNQGLSAARNTGITAVGPVAMLFFLDSDDVLEPDALTSLVAGLDARPDAVGVFGVAEYIDAAGKPTNPGLHPRRQRDRRRPSGFRLSPVPQGADACFDDLAVASPLWPSAVGLYRRVPLVEVGAYDAGVSLREDWDLVLRMARRGPFVALEKHVAWYRRHGANLSRQELEGRYQYERVMRKAWLAQNTPAQRSALRRVAVRSTLNEAVQTARAMPPAVRQRSWDEAGMRAAGLLWTVSTLLRPGPAVPNRRRIRYARGGHDVPWIA